MKAKITKQNVSNGKNLSSEKEETGCMTLICVRKGQILEPVQVRLWMSRSSRASVVYCSIWVHDSATQTFASGYGTAGGWGYHRSSAALAAALNSAGIELYGDCYVAGTKKSAWYNGGEQKVDFKKRACISGVGDSAMLDAVEAIGRALGYHKMKVVGR